ncbi:MAG: carboxyl transferase domain-containing protein, partial [Gordonia sp. (in: high G+C Gram-positive bacteria)]
GNKATARTLAEAAGVPVPLGLAGPVTADAARAFFDAHGPLMLKAIAGGGGRGMREIRNVADLDDEFARCAAEARLAFGDGALYVEQLIASPRHIEVQIVGDAAGAITHLGERDCSVQRRHQKLVEIAPAPALDSALRQALLDAALAIAEKTRYQGLGTVEFLTDGTRFWFIEANPRLQVEHTVTEEVTGIDLVATGIRLALGASLAECGLQNPPSARGFAIQARINTETLDADGTPHASAGCLSTFDVPSGPGVRVDTCGYPGATISPRYDPLVAKVIGTGPTFTAAARRTAAAVAEFGLGGVDTNQALLHAILTDPAFLAGGVDTSYVAGRGLDRLDQREELDQQQELGAAAQLIRAPMAGVVASVVVDDGDLVGPSGVLAILEAMKMEHTVRADRGVVIVRTLVASGDLVAAGAPLFAVEPRDVTDTPDPSPDDDDDDGWSAEVAEITRRAEFAEAMGGPAKIDRQRANGKLTARERILALADPGTFREIGKLAGFGVTDDHGRTISVSPTNFLAGTARVDGRKVVFGVDDFTVRGGSGDAAIHAKQIWLERFANEMRLPMVRLLDGQSGGGSVKMAIDAGYTYVPVNPGWDAVVDSLSVVPVAAAALGPTVGLGAARLVMSHLAVLVEHVGQLFTAGPPVVRGATGEDLTKEELGGAAVHRGNGSVERIVSSEAEAFAVIRAFLSYLPSSVFDIPPCTTASDPADRRAETLLTAVPRNPRQPYAIQPILDAVFDAGSVFRYAEYGGGTVTALARLDGHPVGVIAADPFQGATMSVEGALALARLVDLCEAFHLPIVSLTDQAGMTIGPAAERRATIRHGARALAAVYQARVPQAEIIVRRVYGVGGAGIVNRHRAQRSWAWPSGDWGSLPIQGGIEAAYGAQIDAADDPVAEAARLRDQMAALTSPFRTAEHFGVPDLIDPRDTRALLCDWVHDAYRVVPELAGRPAFGLRP